MAVFGLISSVFFFQIFISIKTLLQLAETLASLGSARVNRRHSAQAGRTKSQIRILFEDMYKSFYKSKIQNSRLQIYFI